MALSKRVSFLNFSTSRSVSRATSTILILIVLAAISSAISFAKFDHCRNTNWKAPDSFVHACYSDIPILLVDRQLNTHQWSYSGGERSVEYPVLTGAVMWATAWISPQGNNLLRNYFDINAFFIALLFMLAIFLVWKMRPQYAYLLALSPAVIASLFINWDMWGIVTMLAAILFYDQRKFTVSAAFLGISIATKFFPVLLLLPIAIIFWRRRTLHSFFVYLLLVSGTWLAINLPVMLTTPIGWWRFYKLNLDRQGDWGSIWHALSVLGLPVNHLNYLSLIALLAVVSAFTFYVLEIAVIPSLAEVSFLLLAAILCIGKVYSPQYVLWLVPLAVLALRHKSQLAAFWAWQGGEAIYHIAIWQHLASVQGSQFGLPVSGEALATLLRIATAVIFMTVLVRSSLKDPPSQAQL